VNRYRIKIGILYCDTLEVEAETSEKAEEIAMEQCEEVYECVQDIETELLED